MTEIANRFLPIHLLNLARSIMRVQRADLVGTWPRASAILGRQALEITLGQLWTRAAPGVENASARAQLTCLPEYVDAELASRIRYSWHVLSAACHYPRLRTPAHRFRTQRLARRRRGTDRRSEERARTGMIFRRLSTCNMTHTSNS